MESTLILIIFIVANVSAIFAICLMENTQPPIVTQQHQPLPNTVVHNVLTNTQ